MHKGEHQTNELIDARDCLANDMGRMKLGIVSEEEIGKLIEKRISVGKRGRSRYGRLVCEFAGCEAKCNVEIKDGILVEKGMRQVSELLDSCSIMQELDMQDVDPPLET